jgi:phosphoglycolate phosphatase-like HAD superfamily hydrolase
MLPSWNNSSIKKKILDFVERVTTVGSPDFVAPSERFAVFDNDGTLWSEFPIPIEGLFAFQNLNRMAEADPTLKEQQPFKAYLEGDKATIMSLGKKGIVDFLFKSHEASTQDDLRKMVVEWFNSAEKKDLKQSCSKCIYQPQLELLELLRENNFKTFIVTGGGIEFVRALAESLYGIPPEQVVGSSGKTKVEVSGKDVRILRVSELNSFDDREEKLVNISLHIGRRPIFAFGNSDGDLAMLQYTLSGDGPRMGLLLHHDDAEREFEYGEDFRVSPLKEALAVASDWGIDVVSMKGDWGQIFPT